MTRIAVLADIHGVLPALEAVLAEPEVRSADRIVLAGDLAAGPQPVETLDLLVSLGDRAVWLRGHADRELVALANGAELENQRPIMAWAATQLRPEQIELLAGLPLTVTLDVPGLGTTVFCHATPRSDEEVLLVDSPLDLWQDVLAELDRDVSTLVCAHTHMPYTRLAHRRLVINPGSVGMPYGEAGAYWALLGDGIGVALRRTPYDLAAAGARIGAESGYPGAGEWADYFLRARASDADALRMFSRRYGAAASLSRG